jgi:radical SAM superfamily enzyme
MVGIIIDNDFDFNLTLKDYKNTDKLSSEAIQFHLAKIFNADKPKKQSIAHCVHMFYGVDDIKSNSMLKFSNWVELQRNIGIDRIRIYVLKLEKKTFDYLNEKYKNFIDLVDHPTKFESICGWIEKLNNLEPDKIIYDVLFKNCKNAFNKVFSPIEGKPSLYKKSGIFF